MLQYKTLSGDKQGSISSKVGMIESTFSKSYIFFESQSEIYNFLKQMNLWRANRKTNIEADSLENPMSAVTARYFDV